MKFYQDENLIPVHTQKERYVTFFLTPFPTGEKRNFRCTTCGKLLCQYESEIVAGVDGGDKPMSKASLEVLCTRCRVVYRLVS